MEVLAKLLKFLNSDIISGVLTAKDVVGTVQEVIDHFKTGNTGLETQIYTLLDYSISEFAKEFRLEYDDKWLWKILGCKEDILKEMCIRDRNVCEYGDGAR